MPLLDHFHAPLYPTHTHLGTDVSSDVAEFERTADLNGGASPVATDGVAVRTWAPPAATMVLPFAYPDDLEVQIRDERDDARVVAVVELVSPRNKDRPEARRAFAAKCATYLQRRIGLVVIDVVTERLANLHDELVALLGQPEHFALPAEVLLYAVAYRPSRQDTGDQIECWPYPLAVGQELPTVPLALRGGPTLPLDLEETYAETRARSRL